MVLVGIFGVDDPVRPGYFMVPCERRDYGPWEELAIVLEMKTAVEEKYLGDWRTINGLLQERQVLYLGLGVWRGRLEKQAAMLWIPYLARPVKKASDSWPW